MHQSFHHSQLSSGINYDRNRTLDDVASLLKITKRKSPELVASRHRAGTLLNELLPAEQERRYGEYAVKQLLSELHSRGVKIRRRRLYELLKFSQTFSWHELEGFPTLALEHFLAVLSVEDAAERLELLATAGKAAGKVRTIKTNVRSSRRGWATARELHCGDALRMSGE